MHSTATSLLVRSKECHGDNSTKVQSQQGMVAQRQEDL